MQYKAEIKVYENANKFIEKVKVTNPLHYEKINNDIETVCIVGILSATRAEDVKPIKGHREAMFELVVSTDTIEYRFTGTIIEDTFHLVHAFVKKEQKTRPKEIEITKQRLKKYNLL
jgi:hypothetical protein